MGPTEEEKTKNTDWTQYSQATSHSSCLFLKRVQTVCSVESRKYFAMIRRQCQCDPWYIAAAVVKYALKGSIKTKYCSTCFYVVYLQSLTLRP